MTVIALSSEHSLEPDSTQHEWLKTELTKINRDSTPFIVVTIHRPEFGSTFSNLRGLADGESRGLDRIGGWHRKVLEWNASLSIFTSTRALGVRRRHVPRYFKNRARPIYLSLKDSSDDVVAQHLRKQLDDVLFAANVDLVLAGHVHAYQRSCAVHRGVCVDGGVVHITAGNSGAELKPDLVSAPWVEANLEQFGFLDITADSEKLEVRKKKYVRCHVKHTCTHRVRRSSYMRAQMGLCLIR